MDFKTFFYKNIIMGFFVASTCISAALAIIGMIFEPDIRFGYQGLFAPLIYGAVTMLPTLIMYSKNELSVRETLARKLCQIVLIELIVLVMVYSSGLLTDILLAISIAMSVFLIYMTVNIVLWISDATTAKAFNKSLLEMQQGSEDED